MIYNPHGVVVAVVVVVKITAVAFVFRQSPVVVEEILANMLLIY